MSKTNSKQIDQTSPAQIIRRLKNTQGQLSGIAKMIEEEKDCVAVITQFKAARAGIERAYTLFLETNLRRCMSKGAVNLESAEIKNILAELTK